MSWHYLQGQEEASSEAICWDGEQFAPSKLKTILGEYCLLDNATECSHYSPSGMTLQRSTGDHGAGELMWCQGGSRVKTSAQRADEKGSKGVAPVSGQKWRELSMRFDQEKYSWKTHRLLWEEDLPWSSVILPRWGMLLDGVVWERTTLEDITTGIGSGFWPTPAAFRDTGETPCNWKERSEKKRGENPRLGDLHLNLGVALRAVTETDGRQNPTWTEWLMGWPQKWSLATKRLETDKFRSWLRTHSEFLKRLTDDF